MKTVLIAALLVLCAVTGARAGSTVSDALQSTVTPKAAVKLQYPKVVLYSVSWCPHCRKAKEYLTSRNIPFINKDVELDEQAMDELADKYRSQTVPVIVLGNEEMVLKGFDETKFRKALEELQKKK